MDIYDHDTAALYRRKQLEKETECKEAIKAVVIQAFSAIVRKVFPCKVQASQFRLDSLPNTDEIREILADMRERIYLLLKQYAQKACDLRREYYSASETTDIDEVFNSGDNNIHDRAYMYSRRLTAEMESWIAIGLLYRWNTAKLISEFTSNYNNPYRNRFFMSAKRADTYSAVRLRNGGASFGRGQYQSASRSLERLATIAIGAAAKSLDHAIMGSRGIMGFSVYRGSSYPCALCDSMVGFHPLNIAMLPPYHAHCCCFTVPV